MNIGWTELLTGLGLMYVVTGILVVWVTRAIVGRKTKGEIRLMDYEIRERRKRLDRWEWKAECPVGGRYRHTLVYGTYEVRVDHDLSWADIQERDAERYVKRCAEHQYLVENHLDWRDVQ